MLRNSDVQEPDLYLDSGPVVGLSKIHVKETLCHKSLF